MRRAGVVIALALGLSAPAAAEATTYCVHQSGSCPSGQTDEGADLQAALTAAQGSSANTVSIGAGTFTQTSAFTYMSTTRPVTITGAGTGQTILKVGGPANIALQITAPAPTSISGLAIDATANLMSGTAIDISGPTPASTTGPTATGLAVVLDPMTGNAGYGAWVNDGATLDASALDGGVTTSGTSSLADDTISSSGIGLIADGTVTASRLRITARAGGVDSELNGDATVDGLLLTGTGSGGVAAEAQNGAKLTIRSATLVDGTGTWQQASATNTVGGTTALTILDSIFAGFDAGPTCTASSGTSNVTFGNDDRHLFGPESCSGGGTFTPGTGNIDVDPQFVGAAAGDYRLRWSSPAVDAGQATCATPCQHSDLDGLTRPIDGDGDGVATRDMGAYEYAHRSPVAHPSASPAAAVTGQTVTFTAGATDPDPGDQLADAWTFDDGTSATGPSVTHAFAQAGTHTATVTVQDPTGLTATGATSITVTPAPTSTSTTTATTTTTTKKDTTAPVIRSLRLSPATFAVAAGRTATLARAGHHTRRHHRGTTIRFTLSERAKVVIALARRAAGIRVAKKCRAPSRAHRHGRACTLYLAAGSLTRRSERAGNVAIAFTGRLAKRALRLGRYRLTATAADPSGNRSRPGVASFTVVAR